MPSHTGFSYSIRTWIPRTEKRRTPPPVRRVTGFLCPMRTGATRYHLFAVHHSRLVGSPLGLCCTGARCLPFPLRWLQMRCTSWQLRMSSGSPPRDTGTISSTSALMGCGVRRLLSIGLPHSAHTSCVASRRARMARRRAPLEYLGLVMAHAPCKHKGPQRKPRPECVRRMRVEVASAHRADRTMAQIEPQRAGNGW